MLTTHTSSERIKFLTRWVVFVVASCLSAIECVADYQTTTVRLPIPAPSNEAGGIVAADLDGDRLPEVVVTVPGHIVALNGEGEVIWHKRKNLVVSKRSETNGLPGHHAAGVAIGDLDGDGIPELAFPTLGNEIEILRASDGETLHQVRPPIPDGAERWEIAMIANLRGHGDRDLLIQATNRKGYRTGRFLAAYAYNDLLKAQRPLWTSDTFVSCAHNGARVADINGDGRDEIIGATIFRPDGSELARALPFKGHMDSVFVADVQPSNPGFEVILLEEGSNHVQCLGVEGVLWRNHFLWREPQNAAVGRFSDEDDDVFVWARSRFNKHQKPFVFNKQGRKIFHYDMDRLAPKGWTDSGVEVIHTIDWTGNRQQLACAKERHTSGDIGLFEPLTGKFVLTIDEAADRLYVADVQGDWREEIVVLAGNKLSIYQNTEANPRPNEKSRWEDANYRKLKLYHNYYSP